MREFIPSHQNIYPNTLIFSVFSPQLFLFVTLFQIQKMRFNFYCKEQEVVSVLSIWGKLHHFLSFSWLTLFKSQITFIRKLMIKEIKDVNNNCAVMCNLIFSLYCAFYLHFYLLLFQPLVVCQVVLEEKSCSESIWLRWLWQEKM